MKKIIIILTIILQLNNQTSAQTNCNIDSKKGLFVELFGNKICKNETLRTNLENYIIRNGYEFILLYGLGGEIFTRKTLQTGELFAGAETNLRLFISNLKTRNSNIQIGAVDGSRFKENQVDHLSLFFNNVNNYNARVAVDSMDRSKCIDFIVLEDEFWSDQSTAYSEYTAFVQPIMDTMKLIAYPAVPYPSGKVHIA